VQEEPDAQVGTQLAEQLRHELELVVLHPHGRVLGGPVRGALGEAAVHVDVAVPPLAVELRLRDEVVVQRPDRGVAETFVEALDLLGRQRDGVQRHPVVLEGLDVGVRAARPADPETLVGAHDRLERRHEPARGDPPAGGAVRVGDAVDGQAVRHDDELGRTGQGHSSTLAA
jgi:hypothetical protein